MTTIKRTQRSLYASQSISKRAGLFTLFAAALTLGASSQAFAFTQLTSQLDFGARGTDVSNLQEFLSASPSIYPSGLITGYFGSMTRAGVKGFQAQYGLDQVGRVGPLTLAKINSIIGGGTNVSNTGPAVFMANQPSVTSTTASFGWVTTNEAALGRVYYSTLPLQMNEGDINSVGFAITSGQAGPYDGVARTTQSSTLTGLQPNTTYYYTIVATDLAGNVSVIGPNNTFRTNVQ